MPGSIKRTKQFEVMSKSGKEKRVAGLNEYSTAEIEHVANAKTDFKKQIKVRPQKGSSEIFQEKYPTEQYQRHVSLSSEN